MRLGGYQKLTLIDYPGKIATTVFTVGCSFRCPFCHNPELVLPSQFPDLGNLEKEFFDFLKKRQGKLEAVCITGGEPTIQPDIIEFIEKIRALGFLVKLDSNGTRPDVLRRIFERKLVDYVAMDIKNSLENYDKAVGLKADKERIKLSVDLIRNSGVDYEFRTTVVPGIHTQQDFVKIAQWIKGAREYYLQEFRDWNVLDPTLKDCAKGKSLDLEKIKKTIEKYFGKVEIRG